MNNVAIFGMSPLPFQNEKKVYGTGIRTWQFALPLIQNKYNVCLFSYAIPSAFNDGFKSEINKITTYKNNSFLNHLLSKEDFENYFFVLNLLKDFKPDAVIGCTFYPSFIASKVLFIGENDIKVPFWADLFGHVMAEGQARAFIDGSDGCLFHYWNSEFNIIDFADIFSCVSKRQSYALIGELGAIGRLNMLTLGYEFTRVMPIGIPDEDFVYEKNVFRGKGNISEDDFVVLWAGGYNTWTDVDTLFNGLEIAMGKNPKIKFVSTGGEIPEQDVKTYPRFVKLISDSKYKDNFLMKGWIDGKDVPNYYFEADIGINIDKDIYEVKLGSKSRILDWMRAGLCVLSSNVCELTEIIEKEKIGFTFKPNDSQDLANKLLFLSENKNLLKKTSEKAKKYAKENFNFLKTAKPVLEWLDNPVFAPDKSKERVLLFEKDEALKNSSLIIENQKNLIIEKDKRIFELEKIASKNLVNKIYGYFKVLRRKIWINKF
jgi:glycosyltransferase involved in cell wall biosynthesis